MHPNITPSSAPTRGDRSTGEARRVSEVSTRYSQQLQSDPVFAHFRPSRLAASNDRVLPSRCSAGTLINARFGRTPRLPGNPCTPASWHLSAVRPKVAIRPIEASKLRPAAEPGAPPQLCLKPPVSASVIGVWTGCLSKCAIARPKSSMSSAARSRVRPCRTKIRWTATSARLAGRV